MKKKIIVAGIFVLLLVAGITAFNKEKKASSVDLLSLYGNIDIREVQLTVNGSEHIAEIKVQEGGRVKKGQLLATLHTELLEAQLAISEAELQAQQQIVNKLKAGSRPQEIAKAKAEYIAAKSAARTARDTAKRLEKLLPKKLASPDDVETAQAKASTATAQAEAAHQA